MADLSYDVQVNTTQAEANLTKLQKTVGGLNDTFIRLKSTLATISLGAVISQSLQFADAISDLSDVSEIAIGNIIGFQNAVMASGGSAEGAQKAILRLVNSIGEAADGSAGMQRAFSEVGITLDDLARLSNQDILQKTIAGLDKMEDSAKRSVLITQLLGKEFRNVATGGLGAAYAQATAESSKYADAIAKGAAAQQNIDKTLNEFKIGLLEAIKPFTELISGINIGIDAFKRFSQAVIAVGTVLASVFLVTKVVAGIRLLWAGITALSSAISGLFELGVNLVRGFGAIWSATEGAGGALARMLLSVKAVGAAIAEIFAPAVAVLKPLVIPILAGIAAAWGSIQDSTAAAIAKVREYADALTFGAFNLKDTGAGAGRGNGQAELDQRKKDAEAAKKERDALREVTDALAKRRAEIQKASAAFKNQNSELLTNIQFEGLLIGKTEDVIEVERARDEMAKRADNQIANLRDAKKALTKDEQALAAVYDQQIAKIEQTYRVDVERVASAIEGLQELRKAEENRLFVRDQIVKSLQAEIAQQQNLNDAMRSINQKMGDIKFGASLKGLSPLRQEIARINEEAKKMATEAGNAFAATFEDKGFLEPEEAQALADGLAQIAQGYKGIADEQIKALGVSADYLAGNLDSLSAWREEFKIGTKDAFTKFKDDANDAGKQAANSFTNFTSGMEDAFVEFAKTGKLSFKSLADSIIADLIRIAVRKAIVAAIGGPLGSIFGFANGGPVMGGTPIIVGERGPELFVPQSAGKVINNSTLKGSGQNTSGMGGGQTVVNYNIQAVDASSFRSLVAKDPSFIYAVTEAGRRSQPTRTR